MRYDSTIVAVGTGVGVIGLLTIPAASAFILQLSKREAKDETYQDEDGKSTPAAVEAFSAKASKIFIFLLAALGFAIAVTLAVLSTLHVGKDGLFLENWLSVGAWVSRKLCAYQHHIKMFH